MLALDTATIQQSHDHPTLCTVTVDGFKGHQSGTASPTHRPEYHWKLPTADPRSDKNLSLHLHTLDIYFWTAHDATSFVSIAQGLLQEGQFDLIGFPPTTAIHHETMSPVVQQLENVAIVDPAFRATQTTSSESSPAAQKQQAGSDLGPSSGAVTTPKAQEPVDFKPLAYNPAAPPAPEPIAHREKTPPPIDGEGGTGLASAAVADHAQTMSPQGALSRPGLGVPGGSSGYIGGPPVSPFGGGYIGSPPSATGPGASSTPSFAPPPPPPVQSSYNPGSPSNQQLTRLNSPKQQPPLDSPANEILGNSYVGGHHQPLQHVQPQYPDYLASGGHQAEPPVGGFSDFKYAAQGQQPPGPPQPQTSEYDIHSQVYRPTEDEFVKKKSGKQAKPNDVGGQATATGKLEERTGKVDKKVNRFFKKLETKIG